MFAFFRVWETWSARPKSRNVPYLYVDSIVRFLRVFFHDHSMTQPTAWVLQLLDCFGLILVLRLGLNYASSLMPNKGALPRPLAGPMLGQERWAINHPLCCRLHYKRIWEKSEVEDWYWHVARLDTNAGCLMITFLTLMHSQCNQGDFAKLLLKHGYTGLKKIGAALAKNMSMLNHPFSIGQDSIRFHFLLNLSRPHQWILLWVF